MIRNRLPGALAIKMGNVICPDRYPRLFERLRFGLLLAIAGQKHGILIRCRLFQLSAQLADPLAGAQLFSRAQSSKASYCGSSGRSSTIASPMIPRSDSGLGMTGTQSRPCLSIVGNMLRFRSKTM